MTDIDMIRAAGVGTEEVAVERVLPELLDEPADTTASPYRVILYNCDCHSMEEVVLQLLKATGYNLEKCAAIMLEAHCKGRAVCYHGSRHDCHRVARVLREIRLQCEVDCD